MSKKKKGKGVNVEDQTPWSALNVALNFNTCVKTSVKLCKQMEKHAENEQFLTQVGMKEILTSAKDNLLYVDLEDLSEKQKKEKNLDELPRKLTPQILAQATKLLLADLDDTLRQARDSGENLKEKKKEEKTKASKKKGGKKGEDVEEEEPEEIVLKVPKKEKSVDMFYFFLDYPKTQEDYLALNEIGIIMNVTFTVKEDFFIEDQSLDLSILNDSTDNFESMLAKRLEAFVESTRPVEKVEEVIEEVKVEEKVEEEVVEKDVKGKKDSKGKKKDVKGGKSKGGKKQQKVVSDDDEEEEEEEEVVVVKLIESFVYDQEDKDQVKRNKKTIYDLILCRNASGRNDAIRNSVIKDLLLNINRKGSLLSYQNFSVDLINNMCSFSLDTVKYQEWVQGRTIHELNAKEHQIQLDILEKNKEEAELQLKLQEEQAELKKQKVDVKVDNKKDKKGKKGKKVKEKKKSAEEQEAEDQAKLLVEKKKKEEEEEKKRELEEAEEKKKEAEKNNLPSYNKQMMKLNEQNITPGTILEALVDQVCWKKGESIKKEQNLKDVTLDEINKLFTNVNTLLKKPTFHEHELNPLKIDKDKEDSTHFKMIVNENDDIRKCGLDKSFFNLDSLVERDHRVFGKIQIPGINKHGLKDQVVKPKILRKAENTYLNSFIKCDIPEFNRRLLLKKFIDMMQEKENRMKWDFGDRTYVERHQKNTLSQTIFNSMIFSPHMIQKYDEDSDKILLCIYFKVPPGRILRQQWKSEWKVVPNLEFWINKFKNNEKNLTNKDFINLDYQSIGDVHDRIKLLYPNDQSVIMCKKYLTGTDMKRSFKIIKEKLIFGIRETSEDNQNEPEGIVNDKPYAEVWVKFENGTQLLFEMDKQYILREKKMEEDSVDEDGDKGEDTLEEAEEVVEEKSKRDTKGKKDDKKNLKGKQEKQPVTVEEEVEEVKQETQKEEELKDEYDVDLKASFTMTMKNGHVIKFLPNGDVLQKTVTSAKQEVQRPMEGLDLRVKQDQELDRIITGKGSVVKHMKDGSIQILYANGNVAVNKRNGLWITTNNKGLRWSKSTFNNEKTVLDPIAYKPIIDPESQSTIQLRQDNVIIVVFSDKSRYTQHKDGTKIWTNCDQTEYIIEHDNYATVKVRYDNYKMRNGAIIGHGGAFAQVGYSNLFERSWDGRLVETYLNDGTKIYGYKEKRELEGYNQFQENYIHLVYGYDGSVFKIQENGDICLISERDRYELARSFEKKQEENTEVQAEIDQVDAEMIYFLQLYQEPQDRKKGIFSGNLVDCNIWTVDDEGNKFTLNPNEDADAYIAVSLDIGRKEGERPETPTFDTREYVKQENTFLPQPQIWMNPRLFVINNDNTGCEFLNEQQLRFFFKQKEKQANMMKTCDVNVEGYSKCESISYVTKLMDLKDQRVKLINIKLPRIINKVPETVLKRSVPPKSIYLYKNLLKFETYHDEYKKEMEETLNKYNAFKKNEKEVADTYTVLKMKEEDQEKEWAIQERIQKIRRRQIRTRKQRG